MPKLTSMYGASEKVASSPEAPAIGDYALIGDCHGAALVSRSGSIDWCCLPRFDAEPCFARLLDWERAGHCSILPVQEDPTVERHYLEDTMVLCTRFTTGNGMAQVYDLMVRCAEDSAEARLPRLLRIVEGVEGFVDFSVDVQPRFGFGDIKPWLHHFGEDLFGAVGGEHGLIITGDMGLQMRDRYSLHAGIRVSRDERHRLMLQFTRPEVLDEKPQGLPDMEEIDACLDRTRQWWEDWSSRIKDLKHEQQAGIRRSAIILKALSYEPTGAIIAAPTTSLPEGLKGTRNWDYRFSWVRDATYTANALVALGCVGEAAAFRRFIERSSAGSARQILTLYGVDGSRRHEEMTLDHLQGYRGAKPVRVGNQASSQLQLDVFGELLEVSWLWHQQGYKPSNDYWDFLVDIIDHVGERWRDPDHGIWEMRGKPLNYVHSKVMCWSTLNRGIVLARNLARKAPTERWKQTRDQVHEAVENHGYDAARGIFLQAFENEYLDASLLRIPNVGFIDFRDERMLRTTDAIHRDLDVDGLLYRYNSPDGLPGKEGAFLACSFWLVECLANQGRLEQARERFQRAAGTANELGLFSEQYDPQHEQLWSNFPQGLTHLSYISAALALHRAEGLRDDEPAAASGS